MALSAQPSINAATDPSAPGHYLSAMRIVLQRVAQATVTIDGRVTGEIGRGFLLLVGIAPGDTLAESAWLADKVIGLRLFGDTEGKMNLDLAAVGGAVLVVSQFTLYGDASKGRRPSFVGAARPEQAVPVYESFLGALRAAGLTVATGEFGAEMQVALVNDGPVTLILERAPA
jgi:D-tyrosyl-tRNA(Tyr) deacylase